MRSTYSRGFMVGLLSHIPLYNLPSPTFSLPEFSLIHCLLYSNLQAGPAVSFQVFLYCVRSVDMTLKEI